METNPVLEELPDEPISDERNDAETASDEKFKEEFDKLAKLDDEWRDYMAQSGSYTGRSEEADDRRQFFFESIATQETLEQHLVGELSQNVQSTHDPKTG